MNNKLLNLIGSALAAAFVFSCSKYDDAPIKEQLSDHEQRIASLEEQCRHLQQDLSSLKQIVEALEKADYITSMVPVTIEGEVVGYTLTFKNSAPITIYNGKDGNTPQISVDQYEDGCWYWTLDGEWMLNESGEKVKAVGLDGKDGLDGEDGKDGVTPLVKIIDEYWYLSVDNGTTWTKLDKATGDKGEKGDSVFQSVVDTGETVVLTLSDGKVINLQKYQPLNISFDSNGLPGLLGTDKIPYTITGNADSYEVACMTISSGITASIEQTDAKHGYLVLICQEPVQAQVAVFVTASDGQSTVRVLSFESGGLRAVSHLITVDDASQVIEVALTTNLSSFEVVIPAEALSWIELASATKGWYNESVYLQVAENTDVSFRETWISFVKNGITVYKVYITQWGKVTSTTFEDFYNNYNSGQRYQVTATISSVTSTQVKIAGAEHELVLSNQNGTNFDEWKSKMQLGGTVTFVGRRNSSVYVRDYTILDVGDAVTSNIENLAEARLAAIGRRLTIGNVLVVGKSSAMYLVQDSALDYMTVYCGNESSVTVGDRINLTATRSRYGGFAQLIDPSETVISSGNSVIVPVAEDVTVSFDTYTWTVGKHVIFRGTLAITGQYNYVNVEGATKYSGSLLLPPMTDAELTEFKSHSGEYITVSGYYMYLLGSRYQYILVTNYQFK